VRKTVNQLSSNRENVAPISCAAAVVPIKAVRPVANSNFFIVLSQNYPGTQLRLRVAQMF
jgi:hypothetical protein